MSADDSALIAAFRASLAKAREIEAENAARRVSFRLHELGVVARIEDIVHRRERARRSPVSYVRATEQIASWLELERSRGGPGMVLRHTLERAVSDIEKGITL